MSRTSIEGFPYSGNSRDLEDNLLLQKRFATVVPVTSHRHALDTVAHGYYEVTASVAVEAGSDTQNVTITGHSAQPGDLVRILTTANGIVEDQITIFEIVDANNFKLGGELSAALAAGDTVSILRSVAQRFDSTGATLASVSTPPIQYVLDGVDTTVTEDTITPANNRPLPVKLTGATGDINITANDLNVQLSHTNDSVQIGDGTEIMAVNASNEAQVADDTARTSLSNIDGKLPATLGQKAMAASLSVAIASDQSTLPISAASLPLPTGAATEATLSSIDGKDFSTETTLAAMSAKLPATLGQKAEAASLSVVLASDQPTVPVSAASLPLPTGAATEATLASIDGKDFATQTTLALVATEATLSAMSAKLPASLGSKTSAASLSVTLASDETLPQKAGRTFIDKAILDYSSTNVTSAAFVELKAAVAGNASMVEIFDSSGEVIIFATGAAASEVEQFYITPGGNGQIEFAVTSATRISLKAQSTTASTGIIVVNFYS